MRGAVPVSHHRVDAEAKKQVLGHFDSISEGYDERTSQGPLRFLRRKERTSVLRMAMFTPYKRMIDVGCGSGFYALHAKRAGMHVCAVDLSGKMIDQVKRFADEAYVIDLECLRLNCTFDLTICAGVLDFVTDPTRAIGNLARLVAPSGRLVIQAPVEGAGIWYYRLEKFLFSRLRVNSFSKDWLIQTASGFGLRALAWERPLPHNLTIVFDRRAIL